MTAGKYYVPHIIYRTLIRSHRFRDITVNYEGIAKCVCWHMRGDNAVQACPDLNSVRVKEQHGEMDILK